MKDLGVLMSDSGRFDEQISAGSRKGRQTAGWLLRVFATREKRSMLILFTSMLLPIMEYCCQLWSSGYIGLIWSLETVQRSFTHKIDGMRELSYLDRLLTLNLYSLEGRRD